MLSFIYYIFHIVRIDVSFDACHSVNIFIIAVWLNDVLKKEKTTQTNIAEWEEKKNEGNDFCLLYGIVSIFFLLVWLTIGRIHVSSQSDSIRDRWHLKIFTFASIASPTGRTDGRTDGRVCLLFRKCWNWHTFPFRSVNLFYMCTAECWHTIPIAQFFHSANECIRLWMQPMHWNCEVHWIFMLMLIVFKWNSNRCWK